MSLQNVTNKSKKQLEVLFSDQVNKYKLVSTIIFVFIITLMAWQSDDAYHAYVMAKNLVLGNGFVYNVGERASASSCPLFTLVIACGYFVIRKMFVVSLLICIAFSTAAYEIVMKHFCHTRKQVIATFVILVGSSSFISYTTSGLENCQLFLLTALFLKLYFGSDKYNSKRLFSLAILISLIAMTRMDAVLMFIPMILYVYLIKRDKVSFIKAVVIGIAGLLPFIGWEIFSTIYYGFPVPNTAYVKLGTAIPLKEYIVRGIQYYLTSFLFDPILFIVPVITIVLAIILKNSKYIQTCLGIILYMLYVLYIGGDFMVGRHFTVLFFISVICFLQIENIEISNNRKYVRFEKMMYVLVLCGIIFSYTAKPISNQYLYGYSNYPISDERSGYFKYTSLYNNVLSYLSTGKLDIRNAWNEAGIDEIREGNYDGGILIMVPGISIYYNSDLYLNDLYALGDPFLSKLPAVREDNWRIGHMWREAPVGYTDTVITGENKIVNEDLYQYYEIIKKITRGSIFDKDRLKTVVDFNLGKYDYLIENYRNTLDEDCHQITDEYYLSR